MIDRISHVGAIVVLVATSLFSFSTSSEKQVQALRNSLDSLELLIQEGRRSGDEIELMIDDAESIKVAIESQSDHVFFENDEPSPDSVVAEKKKETKKLRLPSSFIDWMIVLVGAVALLAALLLAALHMVTRFHRNKLNRRASMQSVPKKSVPQKSDIPVQRMADVADTVEPVAVGEPIEPLPTYTRHGVMKKGLAEPIADQIVDISASAASNVAAETTQVDADHAFVSSMIADLMKRKESVEKGVSNISAIKSFIYEETTEIRVSEFQNEVKTFDDLYDGLEDIMAELDDEMTNVLDGNQEQTAEEPDITPLPEVPQPKIKSTREQIMELHEAGLTANEIGRKLSKSVGEVQLILSMARRS